MSFIWACRGLHWGFRFLRDGGFSDALLEYDKAFTGLDDNPQTCRRIGDRTALRFDDPDDRKDESGRPISHEFVLNGELAARVNSVADGLDVVWPLVSREYASIWDSPEPPRR
ncbi:hypothetical protein BH708_10480 [Brachybacterium sp. P6-10-X1]|uniref:hypothetical protein n=1 Tax=Brachybacterium sp. P6-10-X1 TaxID=1903186 RepID=UPI000971A08A|nr:hypothetical protein [Brachybacterium sp. P6-10-X1]APX33066.1 hypothetical protein BH708_10480 [Brachybacterium sp. P6-10-X1]